MHASSEYVQQQFDRYNALIFGGSLPHVDIRMSRAERFLGKLEYRTVRGPFGIRGRNYGFVMRINASKDLPQDVLDDVIIHEMIHFHIAVNGIRDKSAHGPVFRSMMADINSRYGRHVVISHRRSEQDLAEDRRIREHFVCVSEIPGGELGVTVCNRTMVQAISRSLPRCYRLVSTRWYISTDPYFNRFPRSRKGRIYKADRVALLKALGNSTELS